MGQLTDAVTERGPDPPTCVQERFPAPATHPVKGKAHQRHGTEARTTAVPQNRKSAIFQRILSWFPERTPPSANDVMQVIPAVIQGCGPFFLGASASQHRLWEAMGDGEGHCALLAPTANWPPSERDPGMPPPTRASEDREPLEIHSVPSVVKVQVARRSGCTDERSRAGVSGNSRDS